MRSFIVFFLVNAAFVPTAFATDCSSKEIPVAKKDASASAWSNLRNNEGSIRYESAQLLGKALADFESLKPPADVCADGCGEPKPTLVFSSIPKKYRSDYSDKEKCTRLETETKAKPYEYRGRSFPTQDEFNSWFSDFSQGKGKDGSDLYERCDGDCSPQYFTNIVPVGGKLRVDSEVICGQARDKDDNQYVLTFAYRWDCKK